MVSLDLSGWINTMSRNLDGLGTKETLLRTHKQSVIDAIKPASEEPQDIAEAILSQEAARKKFDTPEGFCRRTLNETCLVIQRLFRLQKKIHDFNDLINHGFRPLDLSDIHPASTDRTLGELQHAASVLQGIQALSSSLDRVCQATHNDAMLCLSEDHPSTVEEAREMWKDVFDAPADFRADSPARQDAAPTTDHKSPFVEGGTSPFNRSLVRDEDQPSVMLDSITEVNRTEIYMRRNFIPPHHASSRRLNQGLGKAAQPCHAYIAGHFFGIAYTLDFAQKKCENVPDAWFQTFPTYLDALKAFVERLHPDAEEQAQVATHIAACLGLRPTVVHRWWRRFAAPVPPEQEQPRRERPNQRRARPGGPAGEPPARNAAAAPAILPRNPQVARALEAQPPEEGAPDGGIAAPAEVAGGPLLAEDDLPESEPSDSDDDEAPPVLAGAQEAGAEAAAVLAAANDGARAAREAVAALRAEAEAEIAAMRAAAIEAAALHTEAERLTAAALREEAEAEARRAEAERTAFASEVAALREVAAAESRRIEAERTAAASEAKFLREEALAEAAALCAEAEAAATAARGAADDALAQRAEAEACARQATENAAAVLATAEEEARRIAAEAVAMYEAAAEARHTSTAQHSSEETEVRAGAVPMSLDSLPAGEVVSNVCQAFHEISLTPPSTNPAPPGPAGSTRARAGSLTLNSKPVTAASVSRLSGTKAAVKASKTG